jgi:hypothetical protein
MVTQQIMKCNPEETCFMKFSIILENVDLLQYYKILFHSFQIYYRIFENYSFRLFLS